MLVQNHGITTENQKGIANYIKEGVQTTDIAYSQVQADQMTISDSGSIYMEQPTYLRPKQEQENNTAVEQFENNKGTSVETRRNQMAVLANTTSPEDYQKMQEEGFSLSETDSSTVITVTDKIKAVLAKAGVDISIYGDTISEEQLKEITGSSAVAHQISQKLQEYDLPVTTENLQESKKALEQASHIGTPSEESMRYLIQNKLMPTISNLYRAEHSSFEKHPQSTLLESDFVAMNEQIQQVIQKAGLAIDETTLADSKWLLSNELPLTEENLLYLNDLKSLSLPIAEPNIIISAMAEAISQGKTPFDAMLIPQRSLQNQAASAMEVIENVTDEDLAYCLYNEQELTISNLKTAIANRGTTEISKEGLSLLTARRQLEEARLLMTTEANYALLKKGISIDTKPLIELVEDLKVQEKQYYKDLLEQHGINASEKNVETFAKTTQLVADLKTIPAYVLDLANTSDSIRTLHESGTVLKDTFVKANERYETLMTAPRTDMGDSIRKAFQNVDAILEDLNLDTTEANRRAVRILAYNQTDLTPENIALIKAKDEEVQRAFSNLTPRVTLEMIRREINPLDMEMEQLNQVAEAIKSEFEDNENQRFEKFLWKLEQNQSIAEEERNSYIGIYRLIAQVEKTDGAVIGSLLNQGTDITMRSLLTAVRNGKKGAMDYQIDDNFEGVDGILKNERIDVQIETAYQQNCVHDIMEKITPQVLSDLTEETWGTMTPEQMKEALQQIQDSQADAALEKQYAKEQLSEFANALSASDEVYAFLERNDLANNMKNILAVQQMLHNPNQMFMTFDKMAEIKKLKEETLKRFGEAIKVPKELVKAQETLAEVAEHAMDSMITENENVSTLDLKALRLMHQQFHICAKRAQEESYMIPLETADGITGISLKIIRGKKEKGMVDILFYDNKLGKVAASFEAKEHGISGMIATENEETKTMLERVASQFANLLGEKQVDMHIAHIPDLSLEHYQAVSDAKKSETTQQEPVQTKRLYQIAETFIQSVSELVSK